MPHNKNNLHIDAYFRRSREHVLQAHSFLVSLPRLTDFPKLVPCSRPFYRSFCLCTSTTLYVPPSPSLINRVPFAQEPFFARSRSIHPSFSIHSKARSRQWSPYPY